jgi:hypothetical protein
MGFSDRLSIINEKLRLVNVAPMSDHMDDGSGLHPESF